MPLRIVRLGTPRHRHEGLRIGTVRRPPRGVRKADYAAQDWFDVWLPDLAPSADTVKLAQHATSATEWRRFAARYRREMTAPEPSRLLDLLAVLSRQTNLSVGCYCEDERHCHRSVLRELFRERGADLVDQDG
jgi:uncharacterized protein YeaO (DUF488 family)